MKFFLKFLLPIGLGCLAGIVNYMVLTAKGKPTEYVRTKAKLVAGVDLYTEDNIEAVPIYGKVQIQAVPWKDRHVLLGEPVARTLEEGDLILLRDVVMEKSDFELEEGEIAMTISLAQVPVDPSLLRVGRRVNFVVDNDAMLSLGPEREDGDPFPLTAPKQTRPLGPFRIVSVGKITSPIPTPSLKGTSDPTSKELTVAIKVDENKLLSEEATLLLKASNERAIKTVTLDTLYKPQRVVSSEN